MPAYRVYSSKMQRETKSRVARSARAAIDVLVSRLAFLQFALPLYIVARPAERPSNCFLLAHRAPLLRRHLFARRQRPPFEPLVVLQRCDATKHPSPDRRENVGANGLDVETVARVKVERSRRSWLITTRAERVALSSFSSHSIASMSR